MINLLSKCVALIFYFVVDRKIYLFRNIPLLLPRSFTNLYKIGISVSNNFQIYLQQSFPTDGPRGPFVRHYTQLSTFSLRQ